MSPNPSRLPLLAALGAALLLAPAVCLAPTEIEPNDDPEDGAYAGAVSVPDSPGTLEIEGTLVDGSDLDAFRLDALEDAPALVVLREFSGSVSLSATHAPPDDAEPVGRLVPYSLRLVPVWPVYAPASGKENFVAVGSSTTGEPNPYRLQIVRPVLDPTEATVKCVLKEAAGKDSFSAKLLYDPASGLGPSDAGALEVVLRDFHESIPAASLKRNAAGTKANYRSRGPGLVRLSWNLKKGLVKLKAKGIDLATTPDGYIPFAVHSPAGALAAEFDGIAVAGRKATKITAVRK